MVAYTIAVQHQVVDTIVKPLWSEFSSQGHFHSLELLNTPNFCSVGLLGSKLLPEVILAILNRYVTLATPPISKHLDKSLEKCQPAVAEKHALNAGNGGPTR